MFCPYCKKYIPKKQEKKILDIILKTPMSMTQLKKKTNMTLPLISYYIRKLREAGIIDRLAWKGQEVIYGGKKND